MMSSKKETNANQQIHIEKQDSSADMLKALKDLPPTLPVEPITVSIVGAGQR
jgi:hypothetical protein